MSEAEALALGEDEVEVSFEKMSKSKGNGVSPRVLSEEFGVDTLRSAIMFGAPPDSDLNFDKNAAENMQTYLSKVEKLASKVKGEKSFSELVVEIS